MQIQLKLTDDAYHFEATNQRGNRVEIDTSTDQGGSGQGAGPMELVAMGLAGCSSIDVLSILRKQRHRVDRYGVQVEARRATDRVPAVFTAIHLHFDVHGNPTADHLRRAIELSLGTYCSVSKMLEKTAAITYSFSLNREVFDSRSHEQQA